MISEEGGIEHSAENLQPAFTGLEASQRRPVSFFALILWSVVGCWPCPQHPGCLVPPSLMADAGQAAAPFPGAGLSRAESQPGCERGLAPAYRQGPRITGRWLSGFSDWAGPGGRGAPGHIKGALAQALHIPTLSNMAFLWFLSCFALVGAAFGECVWGAARPGRRGEGGP